MVGKNEGETIRRNRIEGELLATLSTLDAEYAPDRLELAFIAAKALLAHVHKTKEPYEVLEFVTKYSEVLEEQARLIEECLVDDLKRQMH